MEDFESAIFFCFETPVGTLNDGISTWGRDVPKIQDLGYLFALVQDFLC